MKISVRFALMLSGVGLLASGLQAWVSVRSAEDDLRAAHERDLMVLGRSLQVGFENALRDQQLGDIQELTTRIQAIAPEVEIALLDRDHRAWSGSGPRTVADEALGLAISAVPSNPGPSARWIEIAGPPTLAAILPIWDERGDERGDDRGDELGDASRAKARTELGTIVVVQEFPQLDEAVADARTAALWSVVVFVLGIAVVSLALGRVSISAPLEQLLGAMRRTRLRSLDERLHSQRRDELGELAREFDAMMDRLVATRSALERQQARRHELEQQLTRLDKLATVGQLAATLAHEIGSPLQVLVGRANALAEREHPPDKVRHHAARIAEQGQRITGIVEKLLGYARRRPATRQLIDVRRAAEIVVDLLGHDAERRHLRLQLRPAVDSTIALVDHDQLQQAILNLVRNAFDASEAGGEVEVEVRRADPWVEVVVRDHGVGIAGEDLGQVTEPFFTTRASEGGTGLGLSVVKAIALSHQGELEFRSADAQTEAILRIPRQPAHA